MYAESELVNVPVRTYIQITYVDKQQEYDWLLFRAGRLHTTPLQSEPPNLKSSSGPSIMYCNLDLRPPGRTQLIYLQTEIIHGDNQACRRKCNRSMSLMFASNFNI